MPLANNSYQALSQLADDPAMLMLAWTLDEREFLSTDLGMVIRQALESELRSGLEQINRYAVKDPYGEAWVGEAVARFFAIPQRKANVIAGAGISSLLQSMALLAPNGVAYVMGGSYPDFPYWHGRLGGKCDLLPSDPAHWHERMISPASQVFIERPSLTGDFFSDLSEVAALCALAERNGSVVIIDEANANYCPPSFSAIRIVEHVNNLIVLRGLSKAYGLGSLRFAFAVTSPALRDRVRSVVPPLQASSLSLYIGRKVLELGDVATPLRTRIGAAKGQMLQLLGRAGCHRLLPASQHLPYVLVENDEQYVQSHFEERGIVGKVQPVWRPSPTPVDLLYRLSVPLQPQRMKAFEQRLLSVPGYAG